MEKYLNKLAPILFLLTWGSAAIVAKWGLEYASVWSILTLRATGALFLLLIIAIIFFPRRLLAIFSLDITLIVRCLLTGLILQFAYQSLFFLALANQLSPSTLGIIIGLQPLLISIFAREKLHKLGFISFALGFIGLAIAVYGTKNAQSVTALGLIYGIAAIICISAGSVYQQKLTVPIFSSIFLQYITTSVAFLIVTAIVGFQVEWTVGFILSTLWLTAIVSIGAVLLLFYMLSKNKAGKVGVLFYLVPVVSIVMDYIFFNTTLSLTTVVGATLVIIAIRFHSSLKG